MIRYSLGEQDFGDLREKGSLYIDKTENIIRVLDAGSAYFLSRPRRFGKSLTVSTMAALYEGRAELFEGTYAETRWDFARRERPVVHLAFNTVPYKKLGVFEGLRYELLRKARSLGITLDQSLGIQQLLQQLVEGAAANHPAGKVVLLIDEYDKPIVDFLDEPDLAERNRDALRECYASLKSLGGVTELLFVTGVSAFAKTSIFSDLNHLRDLTLDPLAHTLCGLTEGEVLTYLSEPIEAAGIPMDTVREWYNGYAFGANAERVYNPWSILSYCAYGQLENFWLKAGAPLWLIKMIPKIEGSEINEVELLSSELMRLDLRLPSLYAVLFQAGCLTITDTATPPLRYTLGFPNREVELSFEALQADYKPATMTAAGV